MQGKLPVCSTIGKRHMFGKFRSLDSPLQVAIVSASLGAVFGGIGGTIGPMIQGTIQQSGEERKLRLEASLARQAKLIDAQNQFLTDVTRGIWDWRYASIKVAYYGGSENSAKYT